MTPQVARPSVWLVAAICIAGASPVLAGPYTFTTIAVPGTENTFAFGISDSGQVVGSWFDGAVMAGNFLLSEGVFSTLDFPGSTNTLVSGISESGEVVGSYGAAGTSYVYVLGGGVYTSVPGSAGDDPRGINNSGDVVGFYGSHGFLLSGGVFTTIDVPGSISTTAQGINDSGQVVGIYTVAEDASAVRYGFVLSGGVYTTISGPGTTGTGVFGINNTGQLVGVYSTADADYAFLATPTGVPEPGNLVSAMGALVLLAAWGWRRRCHTVY